MKPSILCSLGTLLLASLSVQAQAPTNAAAPTRGTNRPPQIVSPEVAPDGKVTFRLRAPNAKEVTVSGEWGGQATKMTKNDDGIWSATVGPLKPELYGYSFSLDGFLSLDSGNPLVKPMRSPRTSILDIPGNPPLLHDFQPVPHGAVHVDTYDSKSLGRRRGLYVYTPPDYERKSGTRFPVLYLFHGSGDNEATWVALGRAHWILDNLIAQGKARPMVVVMTDGHAFLGQQGGGGGGAGGGINRNLESFQRDLLEDVMPFVEARYRVRKDRNNRAIAGLSMGGGQSLTIGLNHLDKFGWIGGFSTAVGNPETTLGPLAKDPAAANKKLKLLWVGCGKDDFLLQRNLDFIAFLKAKGITHQYRETEGNHSWPVWRKYLTEFAPLLFQR